MIQSIERAAIVEGLLNTLEAERYVRAPLLLEIIDELAAAASTEACAQARRLLSAVENREVDDDAFARRVADLRRTVQIAVAAPCSTERLVAPAPVRHAEPRARPANAA
jgi:hypothetical protein